MQSLATSMRGLVLLVILLLTTGCVGANVDDPRAQVRDQGPVPAPSEDTTPAVDPADGTIDFQAVGVCTRQDDTISCKGSSSYDTNEIAIGRSGLLSILFEWVPQSVQTEHMLVFLSDGEEYVKAEGPSPLTLEWSVTRGKYRVGAFPSADATGGVIQQPVAWTSNFTVI